MPRLDLVPEEFADEVADRVRARRGGSLTALDRLLLHSPPVADGWNELLGAIRSRTTLALGVRELVICRVAVLNGAAYEWAAHAPLFLASGGTADQLEAVRTGTGTGLSPVQAAALDYATVMTQQVAVPDELFGRLREHFDDRGIVELTATVGAYNLVSRFLVALQLEPDGPGDGTRS
ncbi:MAG: pcaC [Streptosporangiaceae bacterium]|nr:pcaC [Streptosporangiaceae bacterium]